MNRIVTQVETVDRSFCLELTTNLGLSGRGCELRLTERGRDQPATHVREEVYDLFPCTAEEKAFVDGQMIPAVFADYAEEQNYGRPALWQALRGEAPEMTAPVVRIPKVAVHIVVREHEDGRRNFMGFGRWVRDRLSPEVTLFRSEDAANRVGDNLPEGNETCWCVYGMTWWVDRNRLSPEQLEEVARFTEVVS